MRLEASQRALGRSEFDLSAHDGLVLQRVATPDELFLGPSGTSMRPKGQMLAVIVANFKGARSVIYEVPAGSAIPAELVVLHEHSDHYSVQPAAPMTPAKFNAALTAILQTGVR